MVLLAVLKPHLYAHQLSASTINVCPLVCIWLYGWEMVWWLPARECCWTSCKSCLVAWTSSEQAQHITFHLQEWQQNSIKQCSGHKWLLFNISSPNTKKQTDFVTWNSTLGCQDFSLSYWWPYDTTEDLSNCGINGSLNSHVCL